MSVIITPAPRPATTRKAQDPQWVVRPPNHLAPHRDNDQDAAVLHWQSLVDAGLIGGNPPAPPEVVAQREVNDRLFRSFVRPHVRVRSPE